MVVRFLILNAAATLWVAIAAFQPWISTSADPVPESLYRKWLPLALALAAAGSAVVARTLPDTAGGSFGSQRGAFGGERGAFDSERGAFLRRHFLVYLVPLALMLVAHFGGPAVLDGQLGALYLIIGLAFAVHALAALHGVVDGLRDRSAALHLAAIALVPMLVLLPYHRAVMPTASDEPHYLIVTLSLLNEHDLDVRKEYASDRYNAFYPTRLPDVHAVQVGEALYSIRDPGLPILAAIPYALGGRLGVLALMCLVGAALVAQLYLLLRDLSFAPRAALVAVAATALTHPILTYTTQVYPELLTALVFVMAVRAIRRGTAATLRELAIASALLGLLPWLSTRAWPVVVGVGLVIAYSALRARGTPADEVAVRAGPTTARDGAVRAGPTTARDGAVHARPTTERDVATRVAAGDVALRAAAGAIPFTALVLALSFLNWRTFGLFMPSAGYFLIRENQPVLTFTPWIGVPGMLFDRAFGLIPRAPVYLLAFLGTAGLVRRWRAHGAEVAALALGSLLSFVYIADIAYWWADGSPPSRYMLASIPLLVAAVAGGWEIVTRAPARARAPAWARELAWARALAWATVVASAAVAYVFAVLPNIRYDLALDVRATGSSGALFAFLSRATGTDLGKLYPSLVAIDLASVLLALGWLAVAAGLVTTGWRSRPRPGEEEGGSRDMG